MFYPLDYKGMVPTDGIEPSTSSLSERRSTTELSGIGTPRWIRTNTEKVLNLLPLPVGLEEHGGI